MSAALTHCFTALHQNKVLYSYESLQFSRNKLFNSEEPYTRSKICQKCCSLLRIIQSFYFIMIAAKDRQRLGGFIRRSTGFINTTEQMDDKLFQFILFDHNNVLPPVLPDKNQTTQHYHLGPV